LKTVSIRPASFGRADQRDEFRTEFGEIVGDEERRRRSNCSATKNLRNEVGGLARRARPIANARSSSRASVSMAASKDAREVGKKFGVTRERIRQYRTLLCRNCAAPSARKSGRSTWNCRSSLTIEQVSFERADGKLSARFFVSSQFPTA